MKLVTLGLVAGLTLTAQTALAENGFYYGIGIGAYDVNTEAKTVSGVSGDTYATLGLTGGYRLDRSADSFIAAELDADIALGTNFEIQTGASGPACVGYAPHWCSHDGTVRLRGIYGHTIGNYEVMGMLGIAYAQGTAEINPVPTIVDINATGWTLGVGLQTEVGTRMMRLEMNWDKLDSNDPSGLGYDPEFEAVGFKATWMF